MITFASTPIIHKLMTRGILPRMKSYKDEINDVLYICDANHGALLTDPKRRVQKFVQQGDLEGEEHYEAVGGYIYAVPDLATLQSLTYK